MLKLNEVLGVEILNIWIMRLNGNPLFIKDYNTAFNFNDDKISSPMIIAVLDGFLCVFNREITGKKCEVMKFGSDLIFTMYYAEEPINFISILVSNIVKKIINIEDYLKSITEMIGKMFGECYRETLLTLELPLDTFAGFADNIDEILNNFIETELNERNIDKNSLNNFNNNSNNNNNSNKSNSIDNNNNALEDFENKLK